MLFLTQSGFTAAQITGLAVFVGAVTGIATFASGLVSKRQSGAGSEVDRLISIYKDQLQTLNDQNKDLRERQTESEKQIGQLHTELRECREGRRMLEAQVAVLQYKMETGNGKPGT